ncbi:MAG: ATP-binding protein [Lachnospiraceae bacterium]|nr:ATP-binding protein [Lachnospiraceae bacterium]
MKQINDQLKIPAEVSQLDRVLAFLESALEEGGCPTKTSMQICVSAEEIFVNIANYAYPEQGGQCTMDIEVSADTEKGTGDVSLTVTDSGKEFNPLEREDPDIHLSAEDRQIGGLGIWMVKQSMDYVEYRYEDAQNKITFGKKW